MASTKPVKVQQTEKRAAKDASDRCPICLAPPENKAKTNACFHVFCFGCLKEWSKVKAECPLCKAPFRSIFYNIQSDVEYDQFDVPQTPQNFVDSLHQRLQASVTELMIANSFNEFRQHVRSSQENNRAALIASTDVGIIRQRRWYYRNGHRVTHVNNNKQKRDISSKFFRRNPAQLHRLVPWLRRELIVLFGANNMYIVNRVRDLIISCITTCGITSEEFCDEIQPYLQDHTDHFFHEFLSFARSPHDISSYDRNAHYSTQNDSFQGHSREPQSSIQRNPFAWNDALLPIDPPLANVGRPRPSQRKRKKVIHKRPRLSKPSEVIEISSSEDKQVDVAEGSWHSDSSNDVMFVKYVKPPGERTPDAYVTISSNDDETPGPSGLSSYKSHQKDVSSSSLDSSSSDFEPTVRSVIVPVANTFQEPKGKLCKVKTRKPVSRDSFSSRRHHHFSTSGSSSSDGYNESHVFPYKRSHKKHRRKIRRHSKSGL